MTIITKTKITLPEWCNNPIRVGRPMSDFIPEGEPDFVVPPLHENHFQLNCYKVGELDVVVKVHDGVV